MKFPERRLTAESDIEHDRASVEKTKSRLRRRLFDQIYLPHDRRASSTLPTFETKIEGALRKREIADGDLVLLILYRHYVEVLQQCGYRREADVLDHFVAHARPPTAAERQKVLGLLKSAILHESLRHELFRGGPQLARHVQVVVVQEDERVLFDLVA